MTAGVARTARAGLSRGAGLGLLGAVLSRLSLANLRDLGYDVAGGRDLRIDLVRGFLVLAMVVDHVGGDSLLNAISGNNQFLASAAEGFVFVSGFLMGIVYGKRLIRQGIAAMALAILRRTLFLYVTVAAMTFGFVALFLFTEVPLWFDRSYGLGADEPLTAVRNTFLLRFSYNGTDILQIYVLLVAAAPLAFGLLWLGGKAAARLGKGVGVTLARLVGGPAPLLLVTWGLYVMYQLHPDRRQLPWPLDDTYSFPLLAWQALFFTGIALGYHRDRLGVLRRLVRSFPALLALGVVFAGMIWLSQAQRTGTLANLGFLGVALPALDEASFLTLFDKASLGLGRLAAFFTLVVFAAQLVTLLWKPIRLVGGWLLLPLGQSALLVYGLHLFLLGPAREYLGFALYADPHSVLSSTLAQSILLLGILVTVRARVSPDGLRQLAAAALGLAAVLVGRATRAPQVARALVGSEDRGC